ncbi:ATP-binding protein, partial [Streptomyces sp. NPDC059718]
MPTGRRARYGLERLLDVLPAAPRPWWPRHGRARDAVLCFPVRHDPRELGTLRRQVRSALDLPEVAEEAAGDALLVVSELVTNAVTHGTSPAELRLVLGEGRRALRIEVTDAGPCSSGGRE